MCIHYRALEADLGPAENVGATVKPTGEVSLVRQMSKTISCLTNDKSGLACVFDVGSLTMPKDLLSLKTSTKIIDTSLLSTFIDSKYNIKSNIKSLH